MSWATCWTRQFANHCHNGRITSAVLVAATFCVFSGELMRAWSRVLDLSHMPVADTHIPMHGHHRSGLLSAVSGRDLRVVEHPTAPFASLGSVQYTESISHTSSTATTSTVASIDDRLLMPRRSKVNPRFEVALKMIQYQQEGNCSRVVSMPISSSGDGKASLGGLGSMVQALVLKMTSGLVLGSKPLVTRGHLQWYTNNSACVRLNSRQRAPYHVESPILDRPLGVDRLYQAEDGWECLFEPISAKCKSSRNISDIFDEFPSLSRSGSGLPALKLLGNALFNASKYPLLQDDTGFPELTHKASPPGWQRNDVDLWWGAIHAYIVRPNVRVRERVIQTRIREGIVSVDIGLHIRLTDKLSDAGSHQVGNSPRTAQDYLMQASIFVRKLEAECKTRKYAQPCHPVLVYVATDSATAVEIVRKWETDQNSMHCVGFIPGKCVKAVVSNTITQNQSTTHGINISSTFPSDVELQMAEEAVQDIVLLSKSRFFVGLCMSQFARIAVSIGRAKGTMQEAVAMDDENIMVWTPTKLPRNGNVRWRRQYPIIVPTPVPVHAQNVQSRPNLYSGWTVITTVSGNFLRAFKNWLLHFNRLQLPVTLEVIAQDDESYKIISSTELRYSVSRLTHADDLVKISMNDQFNSIPYNKLVSQRPVQLLKRLKMGQNVLYIDIDSVLLRDPFPYFEGTADMWVASDGVPATDPKDNICTGFMAIRSTNASIDLIERWAKKMTKKLQRNQVVFNEVLAESQGHRFRRGKEYNMASNLLRDYTVSDYVVWVHANYLIGLVPKIMRLRSLGLWPTAV